MIDIHCHLLPQVDDGPSSWEIAIEMCEMAADDGITHAVATPHANYKYRYDRGEHQARLNELQSKIGNRLSLTLGCDFHFSYDNVQDALTNPGRYNIGNTRYLLVELSDFGIPPQLDDMIFALTSRGNVPILTHPERHPGLQKTPERVQHWAEMGMIAQITASSLLGNWGKPALKMATWLLEKRLVHVVASDGHSTGQRSPILSKARDFVAKKYGAYLASALVEHNPRAILEDRPLPGTE